VLERASDENVTLADVWRGDRKSNYSVSARSDTSFLNAAEVSWEIFDASDPVVLR
jgi:hypothetical protein